MSKSFISSFLVNDVSESLILLKSNERCSESLRSLTKNEQPWAIRWGHSEEMSHHERITQVTHQKWGNEWIAHLLIFGQKRAMRSEIK